MRFLHPAALVLSVGALALAGCGSSGDDADDAALRDDAAPATTTRATTPTEVTSTAVAPAATETTTNTTTTTAPPATTTAAQSPSGGTAPPAGDDDADGGSGGAPAKPAPSVDGDEPTITLRGDGTARAVAGDAGQAEVWCDNARQGSYDAQLGDATTLVIAVSGSDATQRCELPR